MNNLIDLDNINYINYPFSHCVIDNFLDNQKANILHDEIVRLKKDDSDVKFKKKKDFNQQNKYAFTDLKKFEPNLENIFRFLTSSNFIKKLEKITGISNLITNCVDLKGAGVHLMENNSYLNMHTDFNIYKDPTYGNLERRINLLIYFNKNWENQYNGDLLLADYNTGFYKRIEPSFNRCVIFNTSSESIHGVPEKLNIPQNQFRKSIAIYYYKKIYNNIDFEGLKPHTTIFYKINNINTNNIQLQKQKQKQKFNLNFFNNGFNMKKHSNKETKTQVLDRQLYKLQNFIYSKICPKIKNENTIKDKLISKLINERPVNNKVCIITALFGNYEKTLKRIVNQSKEFDQICFTDQEFDNNNGWELDKNPYHIINKSNIDTDNYNNSLKKTNIL